MIPRQVLERNDSRRQIKNIFSLSLIMLAAMAVVVPLGLIFAFVLTKGLPAFGWEFFTSLPKPVGEEGGGMANGIIGSALLVGIGSLVAVPWGIALGVFLSEYGEGPMASVLRFSTDLLASIPSILIGLFVYAFLVLPFGGFSAFSGAIALAIIMVPVVARSTEEMLKRVPIHLREAGLALGLPRWRVIFHIVLSSARKGVLTGAILAIARAAGETAPLLFTAFGNSFWSTQLDAPIASMPVQIYTYALSPYEEWHRQAWTGALVLLTLVFVLNVVTRVIVAKGGSEES